MEKKNVSRRTFWWTGFVVLLAVVVMDLALWYGLFTLENVIDPLMTAASGVPEATAVITTYHSLEQYFLLFAMPGSFLLFLLVFGAVRWVYRPRRLPETPTAWDTDRFDATKSAKAQAEIKAREQRLFLHLISVLQREGRLIDFFAEDLDGYEDSQIGAAVREIHATCRRVVEKNLSLKPVIHHMEGETVTVSSGFDPGTIKLVGNVVGEPPFSGVLRHRGWQAGKLEMPTFSGNQEPGIIAPAEVELK